MAYPYDVLNHHVLITAASSASCLVVTHGRIESNLDILVPGGGLEA